MAFSYVDIKRHAALNDVILFFGVGHCKFHVAHVSVLHDCAELVFTAIIRNCQVWPVFGLLIGVTSETFRIVILNSVPIRTFLGYLIIIWYATISISFRSESPVVLEVASV